MGEIYCPLTVCCLLFAVCCLLSVCCLSAVRLLKAKSGSVGKGNWMKPSLAHEGEEKGWRIWGVSLTSWVFFSFYSLFPLDFFFSYTVFYSKKLYILIKTCNFRLKNHF